jgi:hypothetical protein
MGALEGLFEYRHIEGRESLFVVWAFAVAIATVVAI